MLTRDFDFDLPPEAIAQEPVARGESRLLVVDAAPPERHLRVRDLPQHLRPGDLLVLNDTRVIPARLFGHRRSLHRRPLPDPTGARIEMLLVEPQGEREWEALVRPGRRAEPGTVIELEAGLTAEVVATTTGGRRLLRFSEPIEPHLDRLGHMPLPPYIKRADTGDDRERYQTVYATKPGAVAAPTAGLHFSKELLEATEAAGVEIARVTLHVGLGTFKPVVAERLQDHRMERERYSVSEETAAAIARARDAGRRVVAVGTTVVRTLEGAAAGGDGGTVAAGDGTTEIFITPGFRFQVVDLLLTNFHLPSSTLLMLVSAFAGRERILAAYAEAIREGYRFYSYGDAMLVERRDGGAKGGTTA